MYNNSIIADNISKEFYRDLVEFTFRRLSVKPRLIYIIEDFVDIIYTRIFIIRGET